MGYESPSGVHSGSGSLPVSRAVGDSLKEGHPGAWSPHFPPGPGIWADSAHPA